MLSGGILLHGSGDVSGVVSAASSDASALCVRSVEVGEMSKSVPVSSVDVFGDSVVDPDSSVGTAVVMRAAGSRFVDVEHRSALESDGFRGEKAYLSDEGVENIGKFGGKCGEEFVRNEVVAGHSARLGSAKKPLEFGSSDDVLDVVELASPQVVIDWALLTLE